MFLEELIADDETAAAFRTYNQIAQDVSEIEEPETFRRYSEIVKDAVEDAISTIKAFYDSDTYKAFKKSWHTFTEFVSKHQEEFKALAGIGEEMQDLLPFIELVLEEDPQYSDLTITELLEQRIDENGERRIDENGEQTGSSYFKEVVEKAKQRKAEIEAAGQTIEEIEKAVKELPLLQAINPKSHVMPNNALMNDLQTLEAINFGEFDIIVSKEKKSKSGRITRREITTTAVITLPLEELGIKTKKKLSEYERQISDAIMTLYEEASNKRIPCFIYPELVYRVMPGGGGKASEQQKEAIGKAIEMYRRLYVSADVTDEMINRGIIEPGEKLKFGRFYLVATDTEYKMNNGTIVKGYLIDQEPIILTYCKMTKQLLTVPSKLLNIEKVTEFRGKRITTGELLPMTATRQAMTGYLLRRIVVIKGDLEKAKEKKRNYDRRRAKDETLEEKPLEKFREQNPIILFDAIFKDAELREQTKTEESRNRNFVFQVLDYWTLHGSIKGYERQIKSRKITGLKILL